jgi:hypothetical protein
MLKINEFQFDAFRQARLTACASHLAKRARRLHPKAVAELDDAGLIDLMEKVIEAARARGLKKLSLMERFSDISMALGAGFEATESWAAEIFANQTMTPADRLREVEASAVFIIRRG